MIPFYHDKDIDMLKLGCTFSHPATICVHKSTDAKFRPFMEGDENFLEKIREHVFGGPSIVLTPKQLLMKLLFESLQTYANLLLELMPANYIPTRCVNPCRPVFLPVGISIQTSRFTPRQNKTRSFENMVMPYFQRPRPDCKIESFYTTGS